MPALFVLLQPKVFHGIIDRVLRIMNKPPMARRLSGQLLLGLLGWSMFGLLWQSLAVWVLLSQPETLGLKISQLGLVAGAYCLAWSVGFMAFWAPGGIGVREVILVATLQMALPDLVVHFSGSRSDYAAFLAFLSLLLRLWTIVGEIIICSISYFWDHDRHIRPPVTLEQKIAEQATHA